jgi:hypothetical protein
MPFPKSFIIALAAFMIVALGSFGSYAEPNNQSAYQAIEGSDRQFFEVSLKNLHDDATNSIGIDYTAESRCSDNNWSTATPWPAILSFSLCAGIAIR